MSEEKIQGQTGQIIPTKQTSTAPQPARRRLLKSTVAIPVIMTLHSGAALARTSNLVGPINDLTVAAKDENGNLYCVHPDPNDPLRDTTSTEPVDLGHAPYATVSQTKDEGGIPIEPNLNDQMDICTNNGINNGILVSANAWLNSIGEKVAGDIRYL